MINLKHKVALIIIITALVTPSFIYHLGTEEILPLKGSFNKVNNVSFTLNGWKNETFQKQKEEYWNENFGLRNFFVRLNNQFYFTFFKQAKANGVVVGKDDYLFEEAYINDYYGINYIGKNEILRRVEKLEKISKVFKKMGKKLLITFAPGKASFYPEFIPNRYKRVSDSTNYKGFRDAIIHSSIDFIDLNQHFISWKQKTDKIIYPKTGIHWSEYGALVAADSINKFLAKTLGYTPVKMVIKGEIDTVDYSNIDVDIENGMNLLFPISKPRYYYPIVDFKNDNARKIRLLTIGDSFYWNIYSSKSVWMLFENPSFGYYFKEFHSPLLTSVTDFSNLNLIDFITKHDVIMLLASEGSMSKFPFDFDSNAFATFCNLNEEQIHEINLNAIIYDIKSSVEWYKSVEIKAIANHISVDEMIRLDAEYVLNQNRLNEKK